MTYEDRLHKWKAMQRGTPTDEETLKFCMRLLGAADRETAERSQEHERLIVSAWTTIRDLYAQAALSGLAAVEDRQLSEKVAYAFQLADAAIARRTDAGEHCPSCGKARQ